MRSTLVRNSLVVGLSFALVAGMAGVASQTAPAQGTPGQGAPSTREPGAGGGQAEQPRSGRGGRTGQSVEQAMNGMGRALRALNETIADASKRDENLLAVNEMQRNCVVAKGQRLPADIHKEVTDPAERTALATKYREELMTLLKSLIDLEYSIMQGKPDMAKTQIAAIVALRDRSHQQMGVKDEE